MEKNNINKYIEKYMKNKTNGAILLNAPWGTGKSYYIQNCLKGFLEQKGYKCIIVSAYGFNNVNDISKSIYMEVKTQMMNEKNLLKKFKKNNLIEKSIIGAKTIFKGITSHFNIDLSISDEDLNKLYTSIDLDKKLIIVEDIERTRIDIVDLLGYINNLTEGDNAKVLLVASEENIEKKEEYQRIKEKTVSDTLIFTQDYEECIKTILKEYGGPKIDAIRDWAFLNIYNEIIRHNDINTKNLRLIIAGIQKAKEIIDYLDGDIDENFIKKILLGCVSYKVKNISKEDRDYSNKGKQLNGLCIDYIENKDVNANEIKRVYEDYCEHNEFLRRKSEISEKLGTIYKFYISSEKDVLESIKYIYERINDKTLIPVKEYGVLANYLLAIEEEIGEVPIVDKCLKKMIDSVSDEKIETIQSIKNHEGVKLFEDYYIQKLKKFEDYLVEKIYLQNTLNFKFEYELEKLENCVLDIEKNHEKYMEKKHFADTIDNDKLIELLKQCNAYQISLIEKMYKQMYSPYNFNKYLWNDEEALIELKGKLEELVVYSGFDKIQKNRVKYFASFLEDIIETFKKYDN